MAKPIHYFVCNECGHQTPKWQGQCPHCQAWHTLEEQVEERSSEGLRPQAKPQPTTALRDIRTLESQRLPTGSSELNRALGGGIVRGGVILLGGEPGIGKSTLLLGAVAPSPGQKVLYVTGEESLAQVKLRAERLGVEHPELRFLYSTQLEETVATLEAERPDLAIIDSIQTLESADKTGTAGSISQVRECTGQLTTLAKQHGISLFIVGHVTKQGELAGPKVLEHMVDTVLYLEGDPLYQYRILRAIKNRFGDTSEIGLFEMEEAGMRDVDAAGELFTTAEDQHVAGLVRTIALEGSRPLLVELQALTIPTAFGYPRRTSSGFPLNRLQLLIAILARRARLPLMEQDVFCNVVGGLTLREPAMDLAAALAMASAALDQPLPTDTIALGELSLSGAVRPARQLGVRLREAARLGIRRALVSKAEYDRMKGTETELDVLPVPHLSAAFKALGWTPNSN